MDRTQAKARAQALVDQMTLEEKASQLRYDSPAIPRLGIPAYNWWNEALHGVARAGVATMFPQAIGMAAAFDAPLMKEVGHVTGVEGRAKYNEASSRGDRNIYKGLTFWAPNVNIFRDPRWGRGHETYGEDPELTSRMGVAYIEGLQGQGEYLLAAACAKHFAVHSGPEALRHSFNAVASKKDMEETYLPAFEACVKEAHVEAVMGAYNRTNGEVCCGSPSLQKILRGTWGFEGHFVSDCWAVADFHQNHKITSRPEESVKLALENGCDVNCGCTYQRILNAVKEGLLDEKYVERSCVRLFTTRFLLGMFDETPYDGLGRKDVETPEHLTLSEKMARESLVLLKNDGILPVQLKEGMIIGVIGPNANSRRALIGNYHGTASRYITVLEGIQDAAEKAGAQVMYAQGSHLFEPHMEPLSLNAGYEVEELDKLNQEDLTPKERHDKQYEMAYAKSMPDGIAEAESVAACSDVVVLVVGLDETLEGEGGDAGNAYASGDKLDLNLPLCQQRLLEELLDCGKPVVVVNMTGSAVDLRLPQEKANAVLQAWYPGARGGKAVAQVLFGEASPSGKLPVTFYNGLEDLPEFTDYTMAGRTYRYYQGEVLYPFGYGLTYGDCQVTEVTSHAVDEEGVHLVVKVRNDGVETDDVLQVYVKPEETQWAAPNASLGTFQRVHLAKGQEQEIQVTLPQRALTTVDEDGVRQVRGNRFTVYVGFSQPDRRSEELTGRAPVQVNVELA
ncbi:MAG: glycoside hydrolase family 3 C-terminal domain-containing protein [Acutalibacter sp.]|jgi:beta-glucosidase